MDDETRKIIYDFNVLAVEIAEIDLALFRLKILDNKEKRYGNR